MTRPGVVAITVWCGLLVPVLGVAQPQRDAAAAHVDALFARWATPNSPGCALAVIRDGSIVYSNSYGAADLEHDVRISPDTVFYVGSLAKQFTGFAVGLLAKEGRLSLDDDVRKYLPTLPEYRRPITVRHLLHHTGGLRDYGELAMLAGRPPDSVATNDNVIDLLSRQRHPQFDAGTEWVYSNTGYVLLASIVERASGLPFPVFARQRIFEPLGMTSTRFHDDRGVLILRRAYAYRRGPSGNFLLDVHDSARLGAGGLYTTVRDLAKWDRNFYDGTVGGVDLIEQMHRMPAGIPRTRNPNEQGAEYGFGIISMTYRGLRVVEHGGSMGGYRARLTRFPGQRFSVALLCNIGEVDPLALVRSMADIYLADQLGSRPTPIPYNPPPPFPAPAVQPISFTSDQLSQYTGTFHSRELDATFVLEANGGELRSRWASRPRGTPIRLAPFAADGFVANSAEVRFSRDERGRVSGFLLNSGRNRNLQFVRLPAE
jgi:CubicO group peptidase (beta-lactamase class C family)